MQEPQETHFAEVARQMFAQRSGIVPALPGEAFADKPPLLPWLVMLGYRLFGVHDWAARLVAGGAGFATVLLTWWWGRRALGSPAALAGAMILSLSAHFVYLGRLLTTDSLLTACVVAAWATAHAALAPGRPSLSRRWWLASALACGLGLLTKGPLALVLVAVPIAVYPWLERRAVRPGGGPGRCISPQPSVLPHPGTSPRRRLNPASCSTSSGVSMWSASPGRSTTISRPGISCRGCCWGCCRGRCCSRGWPGS